MVGLAETLPGPLIKITQFVGFLGAYRNPEVFSSTTNAILGSALTTWVTFVPPMMLIFAFAPFVEQLRGNPRLSGALAAITAAVVGVILNLTLWFVLHVLSLRCARCAPGRYAGMPSTRRASTCASRCARGGRGGPGVRVPPRPSAARRDHGRARHRGTIRPVSAYVIAGIEVTEPATYEEYRKQVLPVVTKCGASSGTGGNVKSKEGDWQPKRIVVLEFPSMDQAEEVLRLTRIRPLIKLRQKASKGRLVIVEGA